MRSRPNVLVVCGRNKRRSRTAEYIFKNDNRFSIRSAGLSPKSERKLTAKDLQWADLLLVMDNEQQKAIWDEYGQDGLPQIEILDIEDEYEYLDKELIDILNSKINDSLALVFNL